MITSCRHTFQQLGNLCHDPRGQRHPAAKVNMILLGRRVRRTRVVVKSRGQSLKVRQDRWSIIIHVSQIDRVQCTSSLASSPVHHWKHGSGLGTRLHVHLAIVSYFGVKFPIRGVISTSPSIGEWFLTSLWTGIATKIQDIWAFEIWVKDLCDSWYEWPCTWVTLNHSYHASSRG